MQWFESERVNRGQEHFVGAMRVLVQTIKCLSIETLKVPKCEIFDRPDFHDFYPIKSLWEGDFGVKVKCF